MLRTDTTTIIVEDKPVNDLNQPPAAKKPQAKDRATVWINELTAEAPEMRELRSALMGDRAQMLDRVRELNLPYIPYVSADLKTFLADPNKFATSLEGDRYFCTIQPSDYVKEVKLPEPAVVNLEKVISQAQMLVDNNPETNFTIVLSEVREIAYLGNFVINAKGDIYGEFTDQNIPPTRGGLTRLFSFKKDPLLDVMRFSFEKTELRAAIYKALSRLPHEGTGRERTWNKGYYECTLYRTPEGGLRPAFYDFRSSESFLFVPA